MRELCFYLFQCESGITKLHSYAVSPELDRKREPSYNTDEQDGGETLKKGFIIQVFLLNSGL